MQHYTVTGMSCAACSARVEKAVSALPGVQSCSVSLLTNSMGVEGDVSAQDVIAAVQAAGYGAALQGLRRFCVVRAHIPVVFAAVREAVSVTRRARAASSPGTRYIPQPPAAQSASSCGARRSQA